jgi:serine protease Do
MQEKLHKHKLRRMLPVLVLAMIAGLAGCSTSWLRSQSNTSVKAPPQGPPAPVVVDGVRTSYADIVSKTTPAVVQITAVIKAKPGNRDATVPFDDLFPFPESPEGRERPSMGLGSGVIVKNDGTILTNHHVIDGADRITVEMNDGETFEAKVIGSDPPSDLAVLKIDGKDLPFLTLGDSDRVRIGDIVLAIGNPLGIGQTVTSGIISAKSRRTGLGDGSSFQDFLQTDAPINQGNSGGALVNVNGELIGINSQILSRSGGNIGIGFAIPSNMAKSVMEQLLQNGEVRRGMLGVNIQNISSDLAEALGLKTTTGVVVSNVMKDSAAEKAGLKRGDIIKKINGEEIEDDNFLRNRVAGSQPGSTVTLSILRGDNEQEVKVTLGEFKTATGQPTEAKPPKENENGTGSGRLGLSLQPLSPEAAERLGIPAEVRGLLITAVDPESAAGEKGLLKGDVVMEINREPVATLEQARTAIARSRDKAVLLLVSRRGQAFFVSIKPE